MKYCCFLGYSRLGNGVPMVTKLVLEIHAICNKNEISSMDLPLCISQSMCFKINNNSKNADGMFGTSSTKCLFISTRGCMFGVEKYGRGSMSCNDPSFLLTFLV